MNKIFLGFLALVGAILAVFAVSYGISSSYSNVAAETAAKERVYTESYYKIDKWSMDEERDFITTKQLVIIDTNLTSITFIDYFARYIMSDRDYSYIVEVRVDNTDGTENYKHPIRIIALTPRDLKDYSEAYSREFGKTLNVLSDSYEEIVEDLIADNNFANYIRKTIDYTNE